MNQITLDDISEHIHLCESECTRLFKRHMNTTLFLFCRNTGSSEAWNISIPKNPSAVLLKKPAFPIPIIIPKYSARLKDAVQENTEKI